MMLKGLFAGLFILMFFQRGVAPHFFELVKFPWFGLHDVDHQVYIINQHPFSVLVPFVPVRNFAANPLYFILHMIADCLYLCRVRSLADNKKVSYCFWNLPHIKR